MAHIGHERSQKPGGGELVSVQRQLTGRPSEVQLWLWLMEKYMSMDGVRSAVNTTGFGFILSGLFLLS